MLVTTVTVLVVAYGDPTALEACLTSVGDAYRLVVVDNASSPETRAVAERHVALYLDPGENLGFASAVNRGLAALAIPETDVLLLNPDALVDPPLGGGVAPGAVGRAGHGVRRPTPASTGIAGALAGVLALPHRMAGVEGSRRPGPVPIGLGLRDRLRAPGAR